MRPRWLLLVLAAGALIWALLIVYGSRAWAGESIESLTSTKTAHRLKTPLEYDLWRGLVIRDGDAKEYLRQWKRAKSKVEIRTATVVETITLPCPPPGGEEAPAAADPPSARPILAAGLVGLGLGVAAAGAGLETPEARSAALIAGGTSAALGVLLAAYDEIAGWFL